MALVIKTDVGAADANSYVDEAFAASYFETRSYTTSWTAIATSQKKALLVWATRLLDTMILWKGYRVDAVQALAWPRSYVPEADAVVGSDGYLPDNSYPNFLKYATCEQALALASSDTTLDAMTSQFSKIELGPLKLDISRLDKPDVLPRPVRALIAPYGTPIDGSGISGGSTARIVRA